MEVSLIALIGGIQDAEDGGLNNIKTILIP
jgi:hypothetical protein